MSPSTPSSTATLARLRLLATALACLGPLAAHAQAAGPPVTAPPQEQPPTAAPAPAPAAETSPAAVSTKAAVASTLSSGSATTLQSSSGSSSLAPRPAVVTVLGSGQSAGQGTRVLKAPSACTPKTNSLDCVTETGQAGQGANVSSRVRNSVIGEVGAGRATTEGAGAAKREGPCTPQPGKLTCD
ncbi:MAG TPA: hypothetical protein H9903_08315 [Candidatus Aquabacterium excrementipullorum]|nr:hypothetical protein [Candidatus Aquabacterium excrementipullorum]